MVPFQPPNTQWHIPNGPFSTIDPILIAKHLPMGPRNLLILVDELSILWCHQKCLNFLFFWVKFKMRAQWYIYKCVLSFKSQNAKHPNSFKTNTTNLLLLEECLVP